MFTGQFTTIATDTDEYTKAKASLFAKHPEMESWPSDHGWNVHKFVLTDIFLLDTFGGRNEIDPEDYYAVEM